MAVTTEKSLEVTRIDQGKKNAGVSYSGGLKKFDFTFTQSAAAGDATSTAELIRVPPGRWELVLPLSYMQRSAFGTARVLDVGYAAYTGVDGVAVVAAPAAFDDDIDVAAAGIAALGSDALTTAPGGRIILQSRDGVSIIATVAGGTIPAAATLTGFFILSN